MKKFQLLIPSSLYLIPMSILTQWWSNAPVTKSVSWVSFLSNIVGSMIFFWNKASKLVTRTCNYKLKLISGLIRELNPGPLTPKARIILLDQWADNVKDTLNLQFFITSVNINGLCHFLHHRLDGKKDDLLSFQPNFKENLGIVRIIYSNSSLSSITNEIQIA